MIIIIFIFEEATELTDIKIYTKTFSFIFLTYFIKGGWRLVRKYTLSNTLAYVKVYIYPIKYLNSTDSCPFLLYLFLINS